MQHQKISCQTSYYRNSEISSNIPLLKKAMGEKSIYMNNITRVTDDLLEAMRSVRQKETDNKVVTHCLKLEAMVKNDLVQTSKQWDYITLVKTRDN